MLTGLAGLAVMAIATPAPTAGAHPVEQMVLADQVTQTDDGKVPPIEVPAPPIVLLFGLAAGALLIRRKLF